MKQLPGSSFPHYQVFGLTIESELELPELLPAAGLPAAGADVRIHLSSIAAACDAHEHLPCYSRATPDFYYLFIKDVAKYLVRKGKEIIIEPLTDATAFEIRLFLLGSALGALQHQRNQFPLHASAITKEGITIAFAGEPGSGKSTMAAAGLARGYSLLSDDVCPLLCSSTKESYVIPGYPLVKMLPDSAMLLGLEPDIRQTGLQWYGKFRLPVDRFSREKQPLTALFILEKESESPFSVCELSGAAKLKALLEHTYRIELVEPLGKTRAHFLHCANLCEKIRIFSLHGARKKIPPRSVLEQLNSILFHHS